MKKNTFFIINFLLIVSPILAQNSPGRVESINKEKFEKLIKERNGKVLLVNFWATWCVPCREEFPDLVKIANEYNVEVVGISLDYPDEIDSKIIPFLEKQKVNFVNYLSGFKDDEELINFINKKWNGALPATAVYDMGGKQISFLQGKKSYKEFKRAVK